MGFLVYILTFIEDPDSQGPRTLARCKGPWAHFTNLWEGLRSLVTTMDSRYSISCVPWLLMVPANTGTPLTHAKLAHTRQNHQYLLCTDQHS